MHCRLRTDEDDEQADEQRAGRERQQHRAQRLFVRQALALCRGHHAAVGRDKQGSAVVRAESSYSVHRRCTACWQKLTGNRGAPAGTCYGGKQMVIVVAIVLAKSPAGNGGHEDETHILHLAHLQHFQ